MVCSTKVAVTLFLMLFMTSTALQAKRTPRPPCDTEPLDRMEKPAVMPGVPETVVTTMHSITIGEAQLRYSATAGWMKIVDSSDNPRERFFIRPMCANPKREPAEGRLLCI